MFILPLKSLSKQLPPLLSILLLLFSIHTLNACGSAPAGEDNNNNRKVRTATQLVFKYPKGDKWTKGNFYNFPYPNDLRVDKDGSPALSALPLPKRKRKCAVPETSQSLVTNFLKSINPYQFLKERISLINKHTRGFGLYSAIYMQFTRKLSSKSLPSVEQSTKNDSSVFLIIVDPKSKDQGHRTPISLEADYDSRFFPKPLVGVRPFEGFPLKPGTQYALVFRNSVKDSEKHALQPPKQLLELAKEKSFSEPEKEKLRKLYAPVFKYLEAKHKIKADTIAAMTIFTTGTPHEDLKNIAKQLEKLTPKAPLKMKCFDPGDKYPFYRCEGTYEAPIFQKGDSPYLSTDEGFFEKKSRWKF